MKYYIFVILTTDSGEDIQNLTFTIRDEAIKKYHEIMFELMDDETTRKAVVLVVNDMGGVEQMSTWERPKYNLNCMFENVTAKVLVNNEEIAYPSGQILYIGDDLRVIANPVTGYEMDYLRVNGTDILSGDTVEVTGDMLVEAKAVQMVTAETTES